MENEKSCQSQPEQELDGCFFLSAVRVRAELDTNDGQLTLALEQTVYDLMPDGFVFQGWGSKQNPAAQLKLWSYAIDANDPVLKALLFFQIIELSYPKTDDKIDCPIYKGGGPTIDLRTEAKLLRNCVTA